MNTKHEPFMIMISSLPLHHATSTWCIIKTLTFFLPPSPCCYEYEWYFNLIDFLSTCFGYVWRASCIQKTSKALWRFLYMLKYISYL